MLWEPFVHGADARKAVGVICSAPPLQPMTSLRQSQPIQPLCPSSCERQLNGQAMRERFAFLTSETWCHTDSSQGTKSRSMRLLLLSAKHAEQIAVRPGFLGLLQGSRFNRFPRGDMRIVTNLGRGLRWIEVGLMIIFAA